MSNIQQASTVNNLFPFYRSSSSSSVSSLSPSSPVERDGRERSPSPASSHSSDVILVCEEKPYRARTPILLSSSESEHGEYYLDYLRWWLEMMTWLDDFGWWLDWMTWEDDLTGWLEMMTWEDDLRWWLEMMTWLDDLTGWLDWMTWRDDKITPMTDWRTDWPTGYFDWA